ncbi:hypothetical protein BDZ97DRAFT_1294422 [Flammula alnicola]|nr:hypothetical protein BDZ97DRAFT_1294422 [Flammula alnicola]
MSETTSPSVQLHPISPSSSLSSTDSAPHSEPTSDEQPDLGAFTTVLREWTHLQPPPRIPVQIRSATSSTTPTFQPSVVGSDLHSRSARSRHSRVTSHSAISSFTRPPSSSAHPEGSTVWNQAPIASYLFSGTPSNDDEEEEYESPGGEGEYTPNSVASTGLTVEIASELDFPSFDDDSQGRVDSSPYPYPMDSGVAVPVPLESESQRLDSRETAHPEDEIEGSETSRDQPFTATSTRHSSQAESLLTSIHLQSQARPTTTANSSSSSLPLSTAAAIPSVASVSNFVSDSPPTFIHALLNRSRNPMPPRTTSDSSFTTSGSASSSNLSLLSYQIPETPPIIVDEESEMPDPSLLQPSTSVSADSATRSALSASSGSGSVSLKTQRSIPTSSSESTSTASFATQRPQQPIQRSFHPSVTGSQPSSVSSTGSPLPNPHSPLPTPEPEPEAPAEINTSRRPIVATSGWRQDIIVNDLGTPDQPPSETFLFDPPRERRSEFQPVVDDDDEDVRIDRNSAAAYGFGLGHSEDPNSKNAARQTSQSSGYASGYDRPALSSERGHGYSQAAVHLERNPRLEPHNEDEDELDEDEDDYPYRYPYSHVLTPRSIGPALTPRGVPPPQPIDPRSQTQTQTATTTTTTTTTSVSQANSLLQQLGLSNQSVYVQHETTSQPQLQPPAQSQSQSQSQHNRTNANLNSSQIALQSQPTAEQPPSSSSSYTYTPYTPPATQSSTGNISQPPSQQPYSSSSQYDIPQIQPQTQTETYSGHRHGYPHSLLGLHALPASLVPPEPGELPPPLSSFGFDASEARSTGGPQAQTRTQAPRQTSDQLEYNISLSDDNTNTTTDTAEAAYAVAAAEDIPVEQVVPSLGVLDGVLSFIAVERERARHNAARDGPASTSAAADVDDSRGAGSGEDGEGLEGEEDWKNAVVE